MLSARGSRELRAAGLALKLVERPVRNSINRSMRQAMNPAWRGAVAERAHTRLDQRVLNTGVRVAPGNPPTLVAAGSTRPLPGGLVPATDYYLDEFGADQNTIATYQRRNRKTAGTHAVRNRHTSHQLPARRREGRVVWPAAAELGPRLASLFVQTIVRGVYEAVEEGER